MTSAPTFDVRRLQAALEQAPDAWSRPSSYRATGVHHGNRRIVVVDSGRRRSVADPFNFVLDAFTPVHIAWLSWIDPGGFIAPHCDGGPWRERWQVPIRTAGWFLQDGEIVEATDGQPFAVSHWNCHAVANPTDRPRIHLVIDRDVEVARQAEKFTLCPPVDDLADLIARAEKE